MIAWFRVFRVFRGSSIRRFPPNALEDSNVIVGSQYYGRHAWPFVAFNMDSPESFYYLLPARSLFIAIDHSE